MDVIRDAQPQAGVPAGAIEHEHDLLARTGPRLTGKLGQLHFKEGNAHGRGQMEEGAARSRMDEADQIAPGEAMLDGGDRALPNGRPDAPEQRFQADPMFVGGPQFDLGARKGGRHRLQQRP